MLCGKLICALSEVQQGQPVRVRSTRKKVVLVRQLLLRLQLTLQVTGAAGFIGFHVSKALARRGDTVVGLDNFNPYYDVQLKRDRVHNLTVDNGINVVEADVCDKAMLDRLFKKHLFTEVVHLAAQAGVRYSIEHPHDYIRSNGTIRVILGLICAPVDCFVTLLEQLRKYPDVKLIYASSSSVYGSKASVPFSVDGPVDHPASLYGATKVMDELTARVYNHLYGISVTGLRFFTVYGPWGRPDMAPFVFSDRISNGEPITVFGDGSMQRDFTYIDDVVNGVLLALDFGADDEIFNVGNGHPIVLKQFIATLEAALAKTAVKTSVPAHGAELPRTFADIKHTTKVLGFQPRVQLAEGVQKFVEWYTWYKTLHQT